MAQKWMTGTLLAVALVALPGTAWAKGGGGDADGGHRAPASNAAQGQASGESGSFNRGDQRTDRSAEASDKGQDGNDNGRARGEAGGGKDKSKASGEASSSPRSREIDSSTGDSRTSGETSSMRSTSDGPSQVGDGVSQVLGNPPGQTLEDTGFNPVAVAARFRGLLRAEDVTGAGSGGSQVGSLLTNQTNSFASLFGMSPDDLELTIKDLYAEYSDGIISEKELRDQLLQLTVPSTTATTTAPDSTATPSASPTVSPSLSA